MDDPLITMSERSFNRSIRIYGALCLSIGAIIGLMIAKALT